MATTYFFGSIDGDVRRKMPCFGAAASPSMKLFSVFVCDFYSTKDDSNYNLRISMKDFSESKIYLTRIVCCVVRDETGNSCQRQYNKNEKDSLNKCNEAAAQPRN